MDYSTFLASKHIRHAASGIAVNEDRLNDKLFPWQRAIVQWWLGLGRAGGFLDCGLGKSLQELAYQEALLRLGHARRTLLLTPPAVGRQMIAEADKFGINVEVRVVQEQAECDSGINVTNYERLHLFEPSWFDVVVLDESSILKSFMGRTKQRLLSDFADTRFRLAATATPAPNDHMELGNHAEFLGVMPSNEMLSRWFINDTMAAGKYRLKNHAAEDFWQWMASFAVAASKPSDLGDFSDEGYILPPLNLQQHIISDGLGLDAYRSLSATEIHKHKRRTATERADAVAKIVAGEPLEPWVIWCDTDYEADELIRSLPDAVEVRGSHKLEAKEEALDAFTAGQIKKLITKPEIAGFGLNWQHCANTAFIGLSHSYERFYQAICRLRRFGQQRMVNCHVVSCGAEESIFDSVQEKGGRHEEMKREMAARMKSFQQDNLVGRRTLKPAPVPQLFAGEGYELWHGDCVDVARSMPNESVDFIITSPPFANLYIYSDSASDMGNAKNQEEFFKHYEYLIAELYRTTVAGRLCAVHCKDLPLYKGRDGAAGLVDFPGRIIAAHERQGWTYHSRVTIWKCPVTEMQRTKNHGLLHKQLCKDSSASRQGMADYLLVFRKWNADGVFRNPVHGASSAARFDRYVGDNAPCLDESRYNKFNESTGLYEVDAAARARAMSIEVWQRYASPVWFDINQMRVLNYRIGRDDKDEKHICPLQLDVIERAIHLWTNPGDLVFDPFNGIASTGYVALQMARRYVGSELKDSYVRLSLENLEAAKKELAAKQSAEKAQPMLFILDSLVPAVIL